LPVRVEGAMNAALAIRTNDRRADAGPSALATV